MSDFTVFDVASPPEAKQRVIVNTDAKNEADDQYAIFQAAFQPTLTPDLQSIMSFVEGRFTIMRALTRVPGLQHSFCQI